MKTAKNYNSDFFHESLLYAGGVSEEDNAWTALSEDSGNSSGLFLTGERKAPDSAALLALAREINRLLAAFSPPDNFQPGPAYIPAVLNEAMVKDLGAASVKEYYGLVFNGDAPSSRSKVTASFPRGPESLRPAVSSLTREKKRLTKILAQLNAVYAEGNNAYEAKIRHVERRLDDLNEMRASLLRAARLWPAFKGEALSWPHHARRLLKKARRLEKNIDLLTKNEADEAASSKQRGVRSRDSLLRSAQKLKQSVAAAYDLNRKRDSWNRRAAALLDNIDNLLAVVIEGKEQKRDWQALGRELSKKLEELDEQRRLLSSEKDACLDELTSCLNKLTGLERVRGAATAEEAKERAESLARTCDGLITQILEARSEAAHLYFLLPSRLGKPVYLDKMFLNTALSLGRGQAISEDMRHRLELFSGRFSSSGKLKKEAEALMDSLQSSLWCDQAALKVAGRRLQTFRLTVQRNATLDGVKEKLAVSVDKQGALQRQMLKNREANQLLMRNVSAAGLEKERLEDQVSQLRRELNELALTKSKLIKVFQRKKDLFDDLNTLRHRLQNENESLKAERFALKERERRLLEVYNREKNDFKKALEELEHGKLQFSQSQSELDASRRELEVRKIKISHLRSELDGSRRDLADSRQENEIWKREAESDKARINQLISELDSSRQENEAEKAKSSQLSSELLSSHELLALRMNDLQELEDRLKRRELDLENIAIERRALNAEINDLNDKLTSADTRLSAMKAELSRYRGELSSANTLRRVLTEKTSVLRRRIEQMSQAHQSLLKTLRRRDAIIKQGDSEKNVLKEKLTRQKANIIRLVSIRQQLRAEMGAAHLRFLDLEKERDELQSALEDAKSLAAAYGGSNAKISEDFESLKTTVSNDLGPLIQVLGTALWQSEAQLQSEKNNSMKMMEDFKLQSDVHFANMRIQSAVREADLIENSQTERRRLETQIFEQQEKIDQSARKIQQLSVAEETWRAERDTLDAANRELNQAMAQMGVRAQKLRGAISTLKKRYDSRLQDAKRREDSFNELIHEKDAAIERQREKILTLEPLIERFLSAASGEDTSVIIQTMRDESKELIAELAGGESLSNNLMLTPHGSIDDEATKKRLEELEPLVEFLAKSFITATADLAQATSDRNDLAEKLKQGRRETTLEMQRLENEIKMLQQEKEQNLPQLAAAGNEINRLKNEIDSSLATRSVLENSLAARESELLEVREQAYRLTGEKDAMKNELEARAAEIVTLKKELAEADRDLEEHDGRLEAAWAALNYLGTKAGDAVAKMKSRLDDQTRQLDDLSLDLKKREAKIKNLEELQDKLAILYWTLISQAGTGEYPALPLPMMLETSASAAEDQSVEKETGGFGLGRQIIESARKVARRSLFTLILTGGLIMGQSTVALSASAVRDLKFDSLESDEQPLNYLSRMNSSYLGRQVSLSFLSFEERLGTKKDAEQKLAHKLESMAAYWDVSAGEIMRLIRTAKGPEHSVELLDFTGRQGAFKLLEVHCPQIVKLLKGRNPAFIPQSKISGLLKAAAEFKPYEGLFWERVFFDFLAVNHEVDEAFDGLLSHLSRKSLRQQWPRHEFAGCLSPFLEIENMGPQTFIDFMSSHIKTSWAVKLPTKGRERVAGEVAGDIYFSARSFKLPLTVVAALAHQELALGSANDLSGQPAIEIYSMAAALVPLINRAAMLWQDGRPPLCDLDEALAPYAGKREFSIDDLYQKKLALIMSYNKRMSPESLFEPV